MDSLSVLGRLRGLRGLTQRQLSRKADIAVETISDIESGVTAMPQIPTIHKLAKALEMDFEELYGLFAAAAAEEEASA